MQRKLHSQGREERRKSKKRRKKGKEKKLRMSAARGNQLRDRGIAGSPRTKASRITPVVCANLTLRFAALDGAALRNGVQQSCAEHRYYR